MFSSYFSIEEKIVWRYFNNDSTLQVNRRQSRWTFGAFWEWKTSSNLVFVSQSFIFLNIKTKTSRNRIFPRVVSEQRLPFLAARHMKTSSLSKFWKEFSVSAQMAEKSYISVHVLFRSLLAFCHKAILIVLYSELEHLKCQRKRVPFKKCSSTNSALYLDMQKHLISNHIQV